MARSRYYKKRIYRYPKQKWSPVIKSGAVNLDVNNQATVLSLVENSTDTSTPTPVVIKAKYFKLQVDAGAQQITPGTVLVPSGLFAGIIYVPEGITIVSKANIIALIASHPEWVIIHTLVDTAAASDALIQKTSILSRNLNSGDRIVFYAYADQFPSQEATSRFFYNISWVNRAN